MSVRGTVTLECDSKGCHAELVIDAEEISIDNDESGLAMALSAHGWRMDDDCDIHCPACCEEGREKNEDDGQEYGHPGDRLAGRE
jgi:hypothetical protein